MLINELEAATKRIAELESELAELREVSQAPMLMSLAAGQDAELRARVSQLEAELAELRANPPKPAIIAVVHSPGQNIIHAFVDSDRSMILEQTDYRAREVLEIDHWIWHPRTETKP
jgi:hypothetical protein